MTHTINQVDRENTVLILKLCSPFIPQQCDDFDQTRLADIVLEFQNLGVRAGIPAEASPDPSATVQQWVF